MADSDPDRPLAAWTVASGPRGGNALRGTGGVRAVTSDNPTATRKAGSTDCAGGGLCLTELNSETMVAPSQRKIENFFDSIR